MKPFYAYCDVCAIIFLYVCLPLAFLFAPRTPAPAVTRPDLTVKLPPAGLDPMTGHGGGNPCGQRSDPVQDRRSIGANYKGCKVKAKRAAERRVGRRERRGTFSVPPSPEPVHPQKSAPFIRSGINYLVTLQCS